MATAKEHIDEIRRTKFSIGGDLNPLTEDLHQAVKNLSAELYAKDVHFLMELIQNAEDNEYSEGVDPSLEFIITSRDITATGAPSTLLIFNNEKGFSRRNIESICSLGRSTKKGYRKRGYIGEKGIGFKSVFLITSRPYIFSNGYQIRFHEDPCPHCSFGYIVPEWVDESPTLSDIRKIYGSATLPTTVLVLPLKADKVKPVKHQLSNIHPQVLLFLTKIKRLSVREDNENPLLNTVNEIAISSETNFVRRKNIDAESYMLHLSAEENGGENECHYFMWKQKFPVRKENKVEKRQEVEEWIITLAFPGGEPLQRGTKSPGVYAFLPTEMITNFPFIIQADFLLASSRETILLDNKWNQGILDCVPVAFVKAFETFVKGPGPVSNLPRMFRFLPVNSSNYQELNVVREAIKSKLIDEEIVPSERQLKQRFFHKPCEVGRLMPAFWNILNKARGQGVSLLHLSSHGKYVLSDSFDREEYDQILNFLGVEPIDSEWYAKCIQSSLLVEGVSEDVYLELLQFIADNWRSTFYCTNIKNIPLLKYENHNGGLSLGSINGSSMCGGESLIYLCPHSYGSDRMTWLIDWNKEFRSAANRYFVPKVTQEAIRSYSKKETLTQWLKDHAKIGVVDVYDYAVLLRKSLNNERKTLVSYVHLLYHSFLKKDYLSSRQFDSLFGGTPLIDSNGWVISQRHGALVPAKGSKWAGLVVSNVWKGEGYIELSEDYLNTGWLAGKVITKEKELIGFLSDHSKAYDIPFIPPPNSRIPAGSAPLTKENAFLLLKWIRKFRNSIPQTFLTCIKERSWLKITLSGCSGSRPPSQSFMLTSSLGNVLQNQSIFVDIPLVDENYYGVEIKDFVEELKKMGVMSEYGEACKFMGNHLMSLAASNTLTRSNVISILNFIKFLRTNYLGADTFISEIQKGKWLKTSCGDRAPDEAVLYDKEWKTASEISDIPFIDVDHYGEEVCNFKTELQLLGVVVAYNGSHQLIVDHLKGPLWLTSLTADSLILLLQCIRRAESSERVVKALKGAKCLKTQAGFKSPDECVLCDPEWACLLQVFNGIPLIHGSFYGRTIFSYKNELKQIGVVVDFEAATKVFTRCLKERAKKSSISKENVMSFLSCYRVLSLKFPTDLKSCIREENWLRTRLGDYRSPRDCILFGPEWESISPISLLPFIDDSENYYGKYIHEYRKELKSMGVVLDFKDGVKFVANRLHLKNPSEISPANALALLDCIQILLKDKNFTFPEAFSKMVSQPWLKTHAGYRSPSQCLLFDSKCRLKPTDGPFIDETHYGFKMASYKKELNAIGVIVDIEKGCPLMFSQLDFLSETSRIVRIYEYLYQHNWKPESEAARRIWIPNGVRNGRWASPGECVISDKSGLFGLRLTVLEKYYTAPFLGFFSWAFQVKPSPCLDDYCKLWKFWETSDHILSHDDCCKFWGYVIKHYNSKTEKTLAEELVKVPVSSGSDSIRMVNKHDAFIPDDLQLKELFEKSSPHPIFVWYREPSVPSFPWTKLLEIFQRIGVRNISESVQKEDLSLANVVESEECVTRDHYGVEIKDYVEELKTSGVMSEYGEACEFIGKHLMSIAASYTLTRSKWISRGKPESDLVRLAVEDFIRKLKSIPSMRIDASGSTTEPSSNILPNGRRNITSWQKGALLGRGSFISVRQLVEDVIRLLNSITDASSSTTERSSNMLLNGWRNITYWEKGALLGRGSFGSVYEGISKEGYFFAVKEVSLLDEGSQGKQSINQLEQEIALLSRFEHENIVQYYGTHKDERNLYIFLELVTKGSLQSLYQNYTLRDTQVSVYTRHILQGLKYLHDRNVIHRDIKCANILVDASGSVKLADFGLAKVTKLNDVKSCKGTVFWMAPEVVNSKNQGYGLPADIWSLGCTVLEMLTKKIPYSGLEGMQAMFKIGQGEPPVVPKSLSNDASDFIGKCLQVDPDARATAAELLNHSFVLL